MGDDKKHQLWNAFGLVTSIGVGFAACIATGLFAGRWLDEKLGTAPRATIGGILLGVATGFWSIYKQLVK